MYILIMCAPFLTMAQTSDENKTENGIHWVTGLSWDQVKQKAKAENKYIFIDAYTTWCGPCRMMDKYVYPNDTVSDFFNEYFIAVKAQMDVTETDKQPIKDWYDDATAIKTEYLVEAYPSLIFLSPGGKILQKEEGYRSVQKLVTVAKESLVPGKVYDDPYKEYKVLVNDYKQGIKHYDRMPFMIKTAIKLNDGDLAKEIYKDHIDYALRLNKDERYTKESIEAWASFSLGLKSKALQFFVVDEEKIDRVMNQKGYSSRIVDKTIQSRIVDSFFRMQKGETMTITGKKVPNSQIMFLRLPIRQDGKIQSDDVEANWRELKGMIRKYFNDDYIIRNVLTARMRWYQQHQNIRGASIMYFTQLEQYPPVDFGFGTIASINQNAWRTFLYVNDKKLLKKAADWQERAIQHRPNEHALIDTYASLLYKMGQTDDALHWEEKALNITTPENEDQKKIYRNVIEKIRKGEPTYVEEGAIWSKDQF